MPFLLDPVLGIGIEARRVVGPSLCQVGLRRYGYSGSGAVPSCALTVNLVAKR